jgi:hypothetical protein
LFDLGKYFNKLIQKVQKATVYKISDENLSQFITWQDLIKLMTDPDQNHRIMAQSRLLENSLNENSNLVLTKSDKYNIATRLIKEDDKYKNYLEDINKSGKSINSNLSSHAQGNIKKFLSEIHTDFQTLPEILMYQDLNLASEFQVVEEDLKAHMIDFQRQEDETTKKFFKRLFRETETKENYLKYYTQNRYLKKIINECPDIHKNIIAKCRSRLMLNYTNLNFWEAADTEMSLLIDKFDKDGELGLRTQSDICCTFLRYCYGKKWMGNSISVLRQRTIKRNLDIVEMLRKKGKIKTTLDEIDCWRDYSIFFYGEHNLKFDYPESMAERFCVI